MPENVIPPGSVVITPSDMYAKIVETHEAVQELKLVFSPALSQVQDSVTKLSNRVSLLERFKWVLIGVAVGSGAAAGGAISAVIP